MPPVIADKAQPKSQTGENIRAFLYAVAIFLVIRVIFFQPFTIPSASMEPNLYQGDYVIVSKWSYGWSRRSIPFGPPLFKGRVFEKAPQRGDPIVFMLPSDPHVAYVKRVIGLPGDRIQMRNGLLYLNGAQVPRTLIGTVKEDTGYGFVRPVYRYRETLPSGKSYITNDFGPDGELDNTDVYVVPAGHYFMMGDNRDNSSDSRVAPEAGGVGYVPAENLVGKCQIVLFSWKPGVSLFKPWTWVTDFQPGRMFVRLH